MDSDLILDRADLQAKSDQLNADDIMSPIVVTLAACRRGGSLEQPWDLHMAEHPGRPWRPCKTMRRLLVHAWGEPGPEWLGRGLRLYRDPEAQFGGMAVGGIRVQAMSHLRGPIDVSLTERRGGKKRTHRVEVLPWGAAAPAAPAVCPMATALDEKGLTVENWDAYATAHDRTLYAAMTAKQRGAAARWLRDGGSADVHEALATLGGL
jgi:hypothetical protein